MLTGTECLWWKHNVCNTELQNPSRSFKDVTGKPGVNEARYADQTRSYYVLLAIIKRAAISHQPRIICARKARGQWEQIQSLENSIFHTLCGETVRLLVESKWGWMFVLKVQWVQHEVQNLMNLSRGNFFLKKSPPVKKHAAATQIEVRRWTTHHVLSRTRRYTSYL